MRAIDPVSLCWLSLVPLMLVWSFRELYWHLVHLTIIRYAFEGLLVCMWSFLPVARYEREAFFGTSRVSLKVGGESELYY